MLKSSSFGLLFLLMVVSACKRDNPPDPVVEPEPFVRLLKDQTLKSRILNRDIAYAVLLPEDYDSSKMDYPVVYLLHGMGDNESAWYNYGLVAYYEDANAAASGPMIYVMPEGFNSYWVNKYNGSFPLMDMIVKELVPVIDTLYRTINDAQHRAVMGYSMGGYGALILPAKNPEVFKTGIVLSMSYRTDEQYMNEAQSSWDYQWGAIFGGIGASGTDRLTNYYKTCNPFYFFKNADDVSLKGQKYFFDCGDDEENLSEPNSELHNLLRDKNIKHEYRVRNGAHTWDYWHKAMPEALRFISSNVQNSSFPDNPEPPLTGSVVSASRIFTNTLQASELSYTVSVPASYQSDTNRYPVILAVHDRGQNQSDESQRLFSTLNTMMENSKIPPALVVEIPLQTESLTSSLLRNLLLEIDNQYRTFADRQRTILIANSDAGIQLYQLIPDCSASVNACLLFDGNIPVDATANSSDLSIYLDICDEGNNYKGYHSMYMSLRNNVVDHEYRVRQGTASHDSFLRGLIESASYIKNHLKN